MVADERLEFLTFRRMEHERRNKRLVADAITARHIARTEHLDAKDVRRARLADINGIGTGVCNINHGANALSNNVFAAIGDELHRYLALRRRCKRINRQRGKKNHKTFFHRQPLFLKHNLKSVIGGLNVFREHPEIIRMGNVMAHVHQKSTLRSDAIYVLQRLVKRKVRRVFTHAQAV